MGRSRQEPDGAKAVAPERTTRLDQKPEALVLGDVGRDSTGFHDHLAGYPIPAAPEPRTYAVLPPILMFVQGRGSCPGHMNDEPPCSSDSVVHLSCLLKRHKWGLCSHPLKVTALRQPIWHILIDELVCCRGQ